MPLLVQEVIKVRDCGLLCQLLTNYHQSFLFKPFHQFSVISEPSDVFVNLCQVLLPSAFLHQLIKFDLTLTLLCYEVCTLTLLWRAPKDIFLLSHLVQH